MERKDLQQLLLADIAALGDDLMAIGEEFRDWEDRKRRIAFLSQIFEYGNTAVEKRAIFYKRLLPLLEFGRERAGIDLSKVVLTYHHLKDKGKRPLPLYDGDPIPLAPITEAGSGKVQEQQKVYMAELIAKLNELFGTTPTSRTNSAT